MYERNEKDDVKGWERYLSVEDGCSRDFHIRQNIHMNQYFSDSGLSSTRLLTIPVSSSIRSRVLLLPSLQGLILPYG